MAKRQSKAASTPSRVLVRYSQDARYPGLLGRQQVQPGEMLEVSYSTYLAARQANPAHYEIVREVSDGR